MEDFYGIFGITEGQKNEMSSLLRPSIIPDVSKYML